MENTNSCGMNTRIINKINTQHSEQSLFKTKKTIEVLNAENFLNYIKMLKESVFAKVQIDKHFQTRNIIFIKQD